MKLINLKHQNFYEEQRSQGRDGGNVLSSKEGPPQALLDTAFGYKGQSFLSFRPTFGNQNTHRQHKKFSVLFSERFLWEDKNPTLVSTKPRQSCYRGGGKKPRWVAPSPGNGNFCGTCEVGMEAWSRNQRRSRVGFRGGWEEGMGFRGGWRRGLTYLIGSSFFPGCGRSFIPLTFSKCVLTPYYGG